MKNVQHGEASGQGARWTASIPVVDLALIAEGQRKLLRVRYQRGFAPDPRSEENLRRVEQLLGARVAA